MPTRSPVPCRWPGCARLATSGAYCEQHRKDYERATDNRKTSDERGYNSRWRKASKMFMRSHPLCAECMRQGVATPAQVVDHIIPHKGDASLFWDVGNWQALCKSCHDRKTATEDGGFGRPVAAKKSSNTP